MPTYHDVAGYRVTGVSVSRPGVAPAPMGITAQLADARSQGELAWVRGVLERVRAGEHEFAA